MNINSAFSKHLKSEDIGTAKPVVTIDRVEMEKVGEDTKPVMYFVGKDKGIVLNRTNSNMMIELTGSAETDEWCGVRIRLFVTKVDFQGRRVPAIRLEAAPLPSGKTPAPKIQMTKRPEPEPEPDVDDIAPEEDSIPF